VPLALGGNIGDNIIGFLFLYIVSAEVTGIGQQRVNRAKVSRRPEKFSPAGVTSSLSLLCWAMWSSTMSMEQIIEGRREDR
jgi:hypothetical protein